MQSVPEREGSLRDALATANGVPRVANKRLPLPSFTPAGSGAARKRALRPETTGAASSALEAPTAAVGGGSRLSWQPPDTAGYLGLRVQIPAAVVARAHLQHQSHHETRPGHAHSHSHHHHHHHHDHNHGEQATKRPRREPSSPTSVGDIDDPKAIPRCVHTTLAAPPAALQQPAAPMLLLAPPSVAVAVAPAAHPQASPSSASLSAHAATTASATSAAAVTAASANSAKMQSVIRGLQHLSACASGCANPLCVSTRNFVAKVVAHLAATRQRAAHDAAKCGACQLWAGIVASHTPTCRAALCAVPLCKQPK